MVVIESSPTWVYIIIEARGMTIITPAPVVITGAIPTTFPWTPPIATPEKQVHI